SPATAATAHRSRRRVVARGRGAGARRVPTRCRGATRSRRWPARA
ncbi:MAG: hypothetical protein AVDCRST_MAG54-4295, partial [uncultured Actinomycetospora sp.]